jgi:hypothetical protein
LVVLLRHGCRKEADDYRKPGEYAMKSKTIVCGVAIAVILQLGVLAASAQTTDYLYSGSETNVTLNPGTYVITAYGAPGGSNTSAFGGLGAEMSAEFNFSTSTNLTLLVGGGGASGYDVGGGGGGGSFVVEGSTPLVIAGGGGGGSGSFPYEAGGDGNVSTNGGVGLDGGGAGGTNGSGGGGGPGGGTFGGSGGGGGFLGNGGNGGDFGFGEFSPYGGIGGSSFENGGYGGDADFGGYFGFSGGFGGGGGGNGAADGGGGGGYSGGGGGGAGYSGGGGGGGGSIIDSSAIALLAEVSGIASPNDPPNAEQYPYYSGNGEIIIAAVPEPASVGLLAIGSLALLRRRRSANLTV